jgi:hypothetical protein
MVFADKLIVVNMFGQPGAGKSTCSADLFALMKRRYFNVELVTEYAKDMVWENRHNILSDQVYIHAKQNRRLARLVGEVDFVVTDSPLLLGHIYANATTPPSFHTMLDEVWDTYRNINFYIERAKRYSPVGRTQNEAESDVLAGVIHQMLDDHAVEHCHVRGDEYAAQTMLDTICALCGADAA